MLLYGWGLLLPGHIHSSSRSDRPWPAVLGAYSLDASSGQVQGHPCFRPISGGMQALQGWSNEGKAMLGKASAIGI